MSTCRSAAPTEAHDLADERGQGMAEYALILALIAVVAIVALVFLGTSFTGMLQGVGNLLVVR